MRGGASSAKYIFISNIFSKFVLVISSVLLARILDVEDFGYLLTLNIIFGFIKLFSISGYEFYFIQNRDHEGKEELQLLRQVFNLRILQSTLLFLITNGVALYFFLWNDPMIGQLLSITSFLFLIGLLAKPEETFLSKSLDYKTISIAGFSQSLAGSISKVIFALLGAGALAFSFGTVIGNLIFNVIIKIKHNLGLLKNTFFKSSIEPYSKIRRFGFHLFLNTSGGFFTKQVDKLFVATFFDRSTQGVYQFANNYAGYPFNALIAPQNSMVLSLMAKNREDTTYLLNLFHHYGRIAALVLCPFILYVYIFAHDLILFIFGTKWQEAVVLFRVFIIYYFIKIILYPTNGILTSLGRPDLKAKITIFSFLISLPILAFLSYNKFDITFYALVFIGVASISDFLCTWYGFKLLNKPVIFFLKKRTGALIPLVCLILLLGGLLQFNQYEALNMFLGFGITALFTYLIIYIRLESFIESLSVFVKNEKLISFFSKCFFSK